MSTLNVYLFLEQQFVAPELPRSWCFIVFWVSRKQIWYGLLSIRKHLALPGLGSALAILHWIRLCLMFSLWMLFLCSILVGWLYCMLLLCLLKLVIIKLAYNISAFLDLNLFSLRVWDVFHFNKSFIWENLSHQIPVSAVAVDKAHRY